MRVWSVFFLMFFAILGSAFSQERYVAEVGVQGGGTFYLGDANKVPFAKMGATYGGFFKYKLDKRYSFGLHAAGGFVQIPAFEEKGRTKTNFVDIEAIAEFNFFDFGLDQLKSTTKRATPYIFLGVGCVVYDNAAAFVLPFGVGGKFKLSERLNLGLTWTMEKVFADDFDKIDNPRGLNKGAFMNNDWYSKLTLSLSFDFWKVCPTCHSGLK